MGVKTGKQITKRLYECEDCHTRRFVPWVELNRASRPKCYGCGSIRLELVSDNAKDDRASLQQVRVDGSGRSLMLSPTLQYSRTKAV